MVSTKEIMQGLDDLETGVLIIKMYEQLEGKNADMKERLQEIKDLSGMYMPLLGTDREAPWVRAMMAINGQAEQALSKEGGE